jgi:hypothetical protein
MKMNRLQDSPSLYLRQHADNPVAWQPWDDAALASARDQDKPLLLSIGYSACHWCHVMAHESFEDPDTAAVMNELFVNIKVDREERPDLDKLYQLSHQLLNGRGGGWPLTLFLDPHDLGAFFAGTYFPPQPRHGLPAFVDLLRKVREWFDANRDAVRVQNRSLRQAIEQLQAATPGESDAGEALLEQAFGQLQQRYDSAHGGFGAAPKFPQAPLLGLVAVLAEPGGRFAGAAQQMLRHSLAAMAASGLRDHLDGGFFRYTVDGTWTIPHFEKMLYDNAQLLPLYAEAAAAGGDRMLEQAASGIAGWLLSEMQQADGGFAASIDADADGQEGGFHVWDREQLEALLDEEYRGGFSRDFGLDRAPNFEGRHWHLVRTDGAISGHEESLKRLRAARAARVPPATDTKVLTAWNALCADGLARAGLALERPDWIDAASATLTYLRRCAWRDGRLYAVTSKDGARFPAYLDDHAFLLQAILSLLQARWEDGLLPFARTIADRMLDLFESTDGGFFFTASDQATPVTRLRTLQDDATPNGNGIAAVALQTLGHLESEPRYVEAAQRTLETGHAELAKYPLAHASLLTALDRSLRAPAQVVICGAIDAEKQSWRALALRFNRVNCYLLPQGAGDKPAAGKQGADHRTTAYICHGMRCLPPVTTPEDLEKALREP